MLSAHTVNSIILEIKTINIENRELTIQKKNNTLEIIRPYGTIQNKFIKLTNNIEYIIENKTDINIFFKKENGEIYEGWDENNNILKLYDNIKKLKLSCSDENIQEIEIQNTLEKKNRRRF